MALVDLLKQRATVLRNTGSVAGRYNTNAPNWVAVATNRPTAALQQRGQEVTSPAGQVVVADYKIYLLQGRDVAGVALDGGVTEADRLQIGTAVYEIVSKVDIGGKAWRMNARRAG